MNTNKSRLINHKKFFLNRKKVTLYEFNCLEENEKAKFLWQSGTLIMNRFEDDYSINLYSLYGFYVETWYRREENRIQKFRTFKNLSQLEPYLDRIDLNLKP